MAATSHTRSVMVQLTRDKSVVHQGRETIDCSLSFAEVFEKIEWASDYSLVRVELLEGLKDELSYRVHSSDANVDEELDHLQCLRVCVRIVRFLVKKRDVQPGCAEYRGSAFEHMQERSRIAAQRKLVTPEIAVSGLKAGTNKAKVCFQTCVLHMPAAVTAGRVVQVPTVQLSSS